MWDFLVCVQVFVHIHGEIHHVCVAEEVQLPLKKLLFIVDLSQMEAKHINVPRGAQFAKTNRPDSLAPSRTVRAPFKALQPMLIT